MTQMASPSTESSPVVAAGGGGQGRQGRWALWAAAAVGIVVALFVGVLATRDTAVNRVADSPLLGRPAPEVTGPALDGTTLRLSDLRGRYVVLNFFATWCVPCLREHPELVKFSQRHQASGDARVLAVIFDDEVEAVRAFFRQEGGDWPVIDDPDGRIALDLGVRGLPETFLVDPDGYVITRVVGEVDAGGLERLLRQAESRRPPR